MNKQRIQVNPGGKNADIMLGICLPAMRTNS